MTQADLAELVGVHWITISRLERGEIKLSDEWVRRITNAMSLNREDLEHRIQVEDQINSDLKKRGSVLHPRGEIASGGRVRRDFVRDVPTNDGMFSNHRDYYEVSCDDLMPFLRRMDVVKVAKVTRELWSSVSDRLCIIDDLRDNSQFVGFLRVEPDYDFQPPHLWKRFEVQNVKGSTVMRTDFSVSGVITDVIFHFLWHDKTIAFDE